MRGLSGVVPDAFQNEALHSWILWSLLLHLTFTSRTSWITAAPQGGNLEAVSLLQYLISLSTVY